MLWKARNYENQNREGTLFIKASAQRSPSGVCFEAQTFCYCRFVWNVWATKQTPCIFNFLLLLAQLLALGYSDRFRMSDKRMYVCLRPEPKRFLRIH